MRVAVIDIGSNSTRLLVCDIAGEHLVELARRSTVTRLADGVDRSATLSDEAIARVTQTLDGYREIIDELDPQRVVGVLTSAVRDASNGVALLERLRTQYGIDARILSGNEEARLTFAGAVDGRALSDERPVAVVDVGGGSTELVIGTGVDAIEFHVSMQLGVVRHSERFLHTDPPSHEEVEALTDDVRAILERAVPEGARERAAKLIAVAGTATSAAAIALSVVPYDPERIEGYLLPVGQLEEQLAHLAALTDAERRGVRGLHPDRAPTIVAGIAILLECARALKLASVEVSDHDILRGAARSAALTRWSGNTPFK